jgi:hypothetical protein
MHIIVCLVIKCWHSMGPGWAAADPHVMVNSSVHITRKYKESNSLKKLHSNFSSLKSSMSNPHL